MVTYLSKAGSLGVREDHRRTGVGSAELVPLLKSNPLHAKIQLGKPQASSAPPPPRPPDRMVASNVIGRGDVAWRAPSTSQP